MEVYRLKKVFVSLAILFFALVPSIADVPHKVIDNFLKREKILSKEAFNAYIDGKDIGNYLKEMKNINWHIMNMIKHHDDIKAIIEYINMEIDRLNYTYNTHSLLRLQRELDESREYINLLMSKSN